MRKICRLGSEDSLSSHPAKPKHHNSWRMRGICDFTYSRAQSQQSMYTRISWPRPSLEFAACWKVSDPFATPDRIWVFGCQRQELNLLSTETWVALRRKTELQLLSFNFGTVAWTLRDVSFVARLSQTLFHAYTSNLGKNRLAYDPWCSKEEILPSLRKIGRTGLSD